MHGQNLIECWNTKRSRMTWNKQIHWGEQQTSHRIHHETEAGPPEKSQCQNSTDWHLSSKCSDAFVQVYDLRKDVNQHPSNHKKEIQLLHLQNYVKQKRVWSSNCFLVLFCICLLFPQYTFFTFPKRESKKNRGWSNLLPSDARLDGLGCSFPHLGWTAQNGLFSGANCC